MKHFILIFTFLALVKPNYASELNIQVLGDRLTKFWAQEFIGSDLVKEEIKEEIKDQDFLKIDLAVIDLGFEEDHITLTEGYEHIDIPYQRNGNRRMRAHHGTSVINLLTGPSSYRVTDQANLINLTAASFPGSYSYMQRRFQKENRYPKVISNSLGWRSEKIPLVVKDLTDRGVLWFLAAGNDYPTPVKELEINSEALLVGSFAPSGLTSIEAQNHPDLFILAPANEELVTINGYGEEHMFGQSSGATPLVAGTVINLLSVLPELTKAQIKKIIEGSAFPSVENKLGFKEMPGLLNGYLAFRVTKRLKSLCDANLTCVDQELEKSNTFIFEEDELTQQQFNCFRFMESGESQQTYMLKEMRRLSFLKSRFHQMETACAYRSLGFKKNAEYFDYLSSDQLNLNFMEEQAKKAHDKKLYQSSYYRYGPYYSAGYLKHLERSSLKEHNKKRLRSFKKRFLRGVL